jgi:3D (Asp-Asp-Asp) domain-containing protein
VRDGLIILAIVVAGCSGEVSSTGADGGPPQPDAEAPAPDAGAPGAPLGTFQITYYWITSEADYSDPPDTSIYDADCVELAVVSLAFAESLALEGTGRLLDGRVLNYDGQCGCAFTPCFHEVDAEHPWGVGVQSRPLVPFRSVAVDPAVLTIGSSYYVLELDGVTMPGDEPWGAFVHDGCIVADDQGGAIDGMQIDFFAAFRGGYQALDGELGLNDVTLFEGGAHCP